ncbi:MAG: crotonase/enoyl-CoA hydratase family protein [Burkholderiales bacterium]|nr:MAG: crotonase/enoyl-CoA hydratase family protein [Burkholderiales bacterium]
MNTRSPGAVAVDGSIRSERRGPVLLLGIDRPARRTGFTPEMAHALAEGYTLLESDPELRVAVVWAVGAHFTAGLDLPRWSGILQAGGALVDERLVDPFDLRAPRRVKPVVYAVQGVCYTLGIELMLAADIVIAAEDCRFSQLEVLRGLMPTGGATVRIAERAGTGNAMLYLLTGDVFGADEAWRMGLVQRVVSAGSQFDAALAIAERIAAAAPLAVQAVVRNARLAREQGPLAAIAEYRDRQARLAASADAREGLAAFRERRAPRFSGR